MATRSRTAVRERHRSPRGGTHTAAPWGGGQPRRPCEPGSGHKTRPRARAQPAATWSRPGTSRASRGQVVDSPRQEHRWPPPGSVRARACKPGSGRKGRPGAKHCQSPPRGCRAAPAVLAKSGHRTWPGEKHAGPAHAGTSCGRTLWRSRTKCQGAAQLETCQSYY